jgi:N-acetylglutamate synthase/N-acetylornithine aminotransferase
MAVNLSPPDASHLHPVSGLELGVARAGIKKPNRKDLLLIRVEPARPRQAYSPEPVLRRACRARRRRELQETCVRSSSTPETPTQERAPTD